MILLLALAVQSQLPDFERDAIVGPKQAFIMLPPDVVCGASVQQLAWSSDGRTLAVVRQTNTITEESLRNSMLEGEALEPPAMTEIWFWSLNSRTGRVVFRAKSAAVEIGSLQWIGNSATVAADVETVNGSGDRLREYWLVRSSGVSLLPVDTLRWGTMQVSPTRDIGALTSKAVSPEILFFDSSGRVGPVLQVKEPIRALGWTDGLPVMPLFTQENGRRKLTGWAAIDRKTGALTAAKSPPNPWEPALGMLNIDERSVEVEKQGGTTRVNAFAANFGNEEGSSVSGLVTGDGETALVAPGNRAIAFVSQGVAMVRKLVPVPKDAYERAVTVQNAKQVGVALMMYSLDADDYFPPNAGWADATNPYIKDLGLLKSFVYTFPGGKLPDGTDPAKVAIGYMNGPGGRATVYGDGSVRWNR